MQAIIPKMDKRQGPAVQHRELIQDPVTRVPSVHHGTVDNRQDREATQMSISRRMVEKAVVHVHNGVLRSY